MSRPAKGVRAAKQRPHIVPTEHAVDPRSLAKHVVPERGDFAPRQARRRGRRKSAG